MKESVQYANIDNEVNLCVCFYIAHIPTCYTHTRTNMFSAQCCYYKEWKGSMGCIVNNKIIVESGGEGRRASGRGSGGGGGPGWNVVRFA
jgi:hypothetical protein